MLGHTNLQPMIPPVISVLVVYVTVLGFGNQSYAHHWMLKSILTTFVWFLVRSDPSTPRPLFKFDNPPNHLLGYRHTLVRSEKKKTWRTVSWNSARPILIFPLLVSSSVPNKVNRYVRAVVTSVSSGRALANSTNTTWIRRWLYHIHDITVNRRR